MLITIVTFFGLCWLPLHSFILVMEITNMDRWADSDLQKVLGHLYFVAHWLAMSNSFVNPIIYGFMNDNFRVSYVIIQKQQNPFSTSRSVHAKLRCYCVGGFYLYDPSVNILLISRWKSARERGEKESKSCSYQISSLTHRILFLISVALCCKCL